MNTLIAKKAIEMLHDIKGIEKAIVLDNEDVEIITKLEEKDEQMNSLYIGRKHNIGVKKALGADILLAFVTNIEYEWPTDNLKIMYQGEIIGRDISDANEIKKYIDSNDHCVFGNIVVNFRKMKDLRNTTEPPLMIISAKTWNEAENMNFVSEALIASPSRLTDGYIKSKIPCGRDLHIGTFLVGLNIEIEGIEDFTVKNMMEN
ncbi:hypothetical protein RE474_07840 [Methanolobus sediminis]|uniref:Uncharacterized protein n=1 Tax=Methanolobus sediminis TaxID=3072978 RepID=A0AA51YKY8_9EURY|nr:hypothetical protein [Methanolobus sediminis]WMW24013.1 hypothetical protein RE474_07840 [Methanolobus sediminis]